MNETVEVPEIETAPDVPPEQEEEKKPRTRRQKAVAVRNFFLEEKGVKTKVLAGEQVSLDAATFKRFIKAGVVQVDVGDEED